MLKLVVRMCLNTQRVKLMNSYTKLSIMIDNNFTLPCFGEVLKPHYYSLFMSWLRLVFVWDLSLLKVSIEENYARKQYMQYGPEEKNVRCVCVCVCDQSQPLLAILLYHPGGEGAHLFGFEILCAEVSLSHGPRMISRW